MTRLTHATMLVATLSGLAGCASVAPSAAPQPQRTYATQALAGPTELLVKFKVRTTPELIETFGAEYGLRQKEVITALDVHVMTILTREEAAAMAGRVEGSALVDYAEPNHRLHMRAASDAR